MAVVLINYSFLFLFYLNETIIIKDVKQKYDVFYGSWCLTVFADWPLFTVLVLRIENGLYFAC